MRILYLDLDALNPSHLSCYGYHRRTSPTIDQIASEGVRCTNVYCSDAPCLPSRTAFYQGRFGIATGVVGHSGTAADPKRQGAPRGFRSCYEEESMPRAMQKHGMYTAMISPFGQRHAAHQYYAGFHEIHNTGKGGMEDAAEVMPVVRRWLDTHAKRDRWYLHINFWDIHTPYRAPASYGNPFENDPPPAWITDEVLAQHVQRGGPHSAMDLGMYRDGEHDEHPRVPRRISDRPSLKQWFDGYDTAIRYVDDCVAEIVQRLKEAGVYEDTAIVISADHGENQGDLGLYGEHGTADQATCHIPFIVRWPGVAPAGKVDEALHYHLDWTPTLMELIDYPKDQWSQLWDGQAFTQTIRTGDAQGRDELILSQCAHVCQRSVRFNQGKHQWLYIRTYHDGLHPFPKHMLFDLTTDPHEQANLADRHPDVLREATWRLAQWHDERMARMVEHASDVTDPMWTVMDEGGPFHARPDGSTNQPKSFPGYLQRLRDTGRAEAADDLARRYPAYAQATS